MKKDFSEYYDRKEAHRATNKKRSALEAAGKTSLGKPSHVSRSVDVTHKQYKIDQDAFYG